VHIRVSQALGNIPILRRNAEIRDIIVSIGGDEHRRMSKEK